jgi:circadian clock protein KaiB
MTGPVKFLFRLYITGNAPNSVQAVTNLTELCRRHLQDQHEVEIIDLLEHPTLALSDKIFMTPTLIKLLPKPEIRIVGGLSDWDPILERLGVGTA